MPWPTWQLTQFIVVPAGIEPAISTFKVWWLCQRRLQDNNGYLRNLLINFLINLNFSLTSLGSCLNITLLDSNVPVNTSLFFIILFFLRKKRESNPQSFYTQPLSRRCPRPFGLLPYYLSKPICQWTFLLSKLQISFCNFQIFISKKNPRTFGSGVLSNCYTFITNLICFLNHMTC